MTENIAVLVVEDDPIILLDIVDQLGDEGFKIYEAANADIAIELLEKHLDIRLVFTDIDMPGSMDGIKLAIAVRKRWPPVRLIVTSGAYGSDGPLLPEGSAFFAKPSAHTDVVRSMRQMLAS